MADETLRANPLLKTLLAQGAEGALTFRGYIGPSRRKGYVQIYPRLADLSQSIEIPEADILHSAEEPRSVFGSRVVWVKKESDIIVHHVERPEVTATPEPQSESRELHKGRLAIRIRRIQQEDTCASVCSCEICQCTCATLPQMRKLK